MIVHPAFLSGLPGSAVECALRPFFRARDLAAVPLLSGEIERLKELSHLEQARPYGWELQGKALLCGLFFELLTRCREGFSGEGGEKVRSKEELARLDALLRRLQARYAEPLSLADLSREIGMSRESCCRFFKRMTGQTLSQYLETYRVSRAIALMQQGGERHLRCHALRLCQHGTLCGSLPPQNALRPAGIPPQDPLDCTFSAFCGKA